ncbi:hypothetical protein MBLNU457_5564t2 [Dothideomycetes sp. NU457]
MVGNTPSEQYCSSWQKFKRRSNKRETGIRVSGLECLHADQQLSTSQRSCKAPRVLQPHIQLLLLGVVVASIPAAVAQNCISLAQSTQCPAFNASSISTDSTLTGLFPFLSSVTDTASFDTQIQSYISGAFAQQRYQQLIGCSSFTASNTTDYYARYTTSVLCNAIVQNSITPCQLSGSATTPLCADSCAEYASSEQSIADSSLCGTTGPNALSQIRADFTNCALPANILSGSCIQAYRNEPDNCGYASNLGGLCSYCAASSPNSTDSCCVFSDTELRCQDVVLPVAATSASTIAFSTMTPTASVTQSSTATGSAAPTAVSRRRGLSGGAIAGIVIGSILGAFLLLAALILGCLFLRRRKSSSPANSVFNKPSQARQGPPMAMHDGAVEAVALPGGRIARMAAIEDEPVGTPQRTAFGADRNRDSPSGDDTLGSRHSPTAAPRRGRSLGAGSPFTMAGAADDSPGNTLSSPEGTGQSEQLNFFGDYYSQEEIHPGDLVSTLWAYQPRAQDEFDLDRGDMLKVVGIWDDGWATGVRVRQRAEDWRDPHRDSGMSSGASSPETENEVKAFPLVCVCLPQHWRKTIEGETTEESTGQS